MPRAALLLAAGALVLAVRPRPMARAVRILRFSRVVGDLERAVGFYTEALGFRVVARGPASATPFDVSGVAEAVLRLGGEEVALVRSPNGAAYPADSRSNDLWFQHLAIVVSDMDAAYAYLSRHGGWRPISDGGSQTLPAANGGVRALKFRDPDGHPLELIWFPPGQGRTIWHRKAGRAVFLGIDHSALAVGSTARSLGFYRALGLDVRSRSLNTGPAQARLDGLAGARVRVTGLRAGLDDGPGLELLAYRPPGRAASELRAGDVAADWVTLAVTGLSGEVRRAVRDPDGHRLLLVDQGSLTAPACGPVT